MIQTSLNFFSPQDVLSLYGILFPHRNNWPKRLSNLVKSISRFQCLYSLDKSFNSFCIICPSLRIWPTSFITLTLRAKRLLIILTSPQLTDLFWRSTIIIIGSSSQNSSEILLNQSHFFFLAVWIRLLQFYKSCHVYNFILVSVDLRLKLLYPLCKALNC